MEAPVRPELAQTAATRVGMGGSPPDGEPVRDRFRRRPAKDLPADAPVEAAVVIGNGELTQLITRKNDVTGGWRVPSTCTQPAGILSSCAALRLGDKR